MFRGRVSIASNFATQEAGAAAQNRQMNAEQIRQYALMAQNVYERSAFNPQLTNIQQRIATVKPAKQCDGCGARERINGICAYCGGQH